MVQCESLTSFFHTHGPRRRDGSFFPYGYPIRADIPRRLALCQLVQGFLDIQDGRRPTQRGKQHLHARPRKRRLQYDTSLEKKIDTTRYCIYSSSIQLYLDRDRVDGRS